VFRGGAPDSDSPLCRQLLDDGKTSRRIAELPRTAALRGRGLSSVPPDAAACVGCFNPVSNAKDWRHVALPENASDYAIRPEWRGTGAKIIIRDASSTDDANTIH